MGNKLQCWDKFASAAAPYEVDMGSAVIEVMVQHQHRCAIALNPTPGDQMKTITKCFHSKESPTQKFFGGSAYATEVDGIYQGSCAIVENTACASRLFCWGLSSGGDAAAQVTGDPTCMDLSSLPGTSSQTFSGSVSGLHAVSMSGGWNHMCVLLSNEQLVCFGENNNAVVSTSASKESELTGGVASVHCGSYSTCILPKGFNGPPVCWGNSNNFNTAQVAFHPVYASDHGYQHCFGGPNGETACGGANAATYSISIPSGFEFRPIL